SEINAFADGAENLIHTAQSAYQSRKAQLEQKHKAELADLENKYRTYSDSVNRKSQSTISEAKTILASTEYLDKRLSAIDKYYVKTKRKKEELLAETTSQEFAEATDYFETLARIQASYQVLYKKYTEDILPGLLNGLNYFFSNQRKRDYEELIILKNTVAAFVVEIEMELPAITSGSLQAIKDGYLSRVNILKKEQQDESAQLNSDYQAALEKVADKIYFTLDSLLPDELVSCLHDLITGYEANLYKVNGTSEISGGILNMCFVDYPVDFFVENKIVASIIKDKCRLLLTEDGAIRFPIIMSIRNTPVWMIQNDGSNTTAVQEFTHSLMFGMLSTLPVSKLSFSVIDPENRGNSISPYFDARKKLPELFGEKLYVSREDISAKIAKLNEKIEEILQYRLGNQYDTIFAYAEDNPDFSVATEMLVIYDFPREFDERTLADLRNILRNGSRCGIFAYLSCCRGNENSRSAEFEQNLQTIRDLSTVIEQNDRNFLLRGLSLAYYPMPDKTEFTQYFSKYMLIYEGIQNRGIAFSPLIKKLVDTQDLTELSAHISLIREMLKNYEKEYSRVPDLKAAFPSTVTLGTVLYPADIFSESIGYDQIVDVFGSGDRNEDSAGSVELPLTFDLRNGFNLLLSCPDAVQREMQTFTHHIIWSFLSFLPVTKVNICVFDAEQRGNSIIPFLDFRKRSPETFDQKIYTNQDMILERLQKVNAQIDEFIQEKLGNRYQDILDYNLHTPKRAEALTLLLLYDFPGGMEGRSLDLLSNILRNGNKCGVFTVICHNPNITFSRYESIDERLENIQRYCVMAEYKDRHYRLLPYNLQINIPELLHGSDADDFMKDYVAKSEKIRKQGVSFQDVVPDELFSRDSSKALRIPVGIGNGDAVVELVIGEGSSHHGLIAGATGSGKSTLLHTIIMSSMLHYSPDQLNLYLMDFKSGTEFKVYESVKLPHIKLLALDAMQEFGESILENLVSEMEHRGSLFKEAGQTSLKGYVQSTGNALPRILVIMDEFQILFNDSGNRKVAMNCAELTKRIVTEGRAFGIHLLMATQSTKVISDLTLSRGTIEQMRIRIGLKCGEDDARYLFSENDIKALSMMKGSIGTAVMNPDYTEKENIGFRTAYCDDETQKEYLEKISVSFADSPYTLQTFEGSRTVRLLDYYREAGLTMTDESPIRIHMGALIKVAPPFAIRIDKKRKHNLLICGSNERMAGILSGNYMISALLNQNSRVYCIDGDILIGEENSQEFYRVLSSMSPNFQTASDRSDIIRFIRDIYDEYQLRKKHNSSEAIFVVIRNLQFLDIVKSMMKGEMIDESEYLDEEPEQEMEIDSANPFAAINNMFASRGSSDQSGVSEKLLRLIADGSGFGIHFVVTSLEFQTVRETMYYGENILSRFPERIVFSLGSNDAESLIENVSISGLRDNTVYYTDGVKYTFQMKPYITPSPAELIAFWEEIKSM
ncbi:MAG: cell division protein FtsK, partial [Blautia sp.]|nr:cell division protein FtsK [Blautia sp.]